jgi:hypothetical protein
MMIRRKQSMLLWFRTDSRRLPRRLDPCARTRVARQRIGIAVTLFAVVLVPAVVLYVAPSVWAKRQGQHLDEQKSGPNQSTLDVF